VALDLEGAASALNIARTLEGVKELELEPEKLLRLGERAEGASDLPEWRKRGTVGMHDPSFRIEAI
jgi:hypothetical protein